MSTIGVLQIIDLMKSLNGGPFYLLWNLKTSFANFEIWPLIIQ